jgi:hypothetical protein
MQSGLLGSQEDAESLRTQSVQSGAASLHHWCQTVDSSKNIDHYLMEEDDGEVRISHPAAESEAPPLERIVVSVIKSTQTS